jgi:hypothetical protein
MNKDRLGYYQVGFKKFYNKTLALLENHRTGYEVEWVFNNDVYGKIDWAVPIETHLSVLYKQRAQQLRDKYDYLALQYSGGADSNNVLHAFIDNDIFLDEIVMQLPELDRKNFNNQDTTERNVNGEIDFEATPHLQKYKDKIHPNTRIRYQDYSKPLLELLTHDDWFEKTPTGSNMCLTGVARQITQVSDPEILKLAYQGKTVGLIQGVDKPLVYFAGNHYYAYFSDLNAMHNAPAELNLQEIFSKFYCTEFFYWTPDMPEIVVKQAQLIKQFAESNPHAKDMLSKSRTIHVKHFKPLVHPIIYPPHTEPTFQTDKPSFKIFRDVDSWFWGVATDQQKGNYLSTIEYIGKNIKESRFINQSIDNGMQATLSKFYQL